MIGHAVPLSDKAKLTKAVVDRAAHPAPGATRSLFHLWDTDLRGFALRVSPAGGKSFIVDWRMPGGRGAPKGQHTIGRYGSPFTVEMARAAAREVLAKVKAGVNPTQERRDDARRAVELAFNKVSARFVDSYARRNQPRTWKQARRTLERDVVPVFGSRLIGEITRRDVNALLHEQAARAPQQSRYTHATLRKLFRWAVDSGLIDRSPIEGMAAIEPAKTRDRVLTDAELVEVWRAAEALGDPFRSIHRLLIATGQRREEVGGMAWSEIDMAGRTWTIPSARAKNVKAHVVPLNALAMATLEGLAGTTWRGRDDGADLLFSSNGDTAPSGWSKAKARLDTLIAAARVKAAVEGGRDPAKVAAMPAWRVHDLRRTMATGLQRLGVRLEVTEAVLNHVSGSRSGIVGVYQRHDWADEKRAAMDAWGAYVTALLEGAAAPSNVVPIARRAVG